MEPRRLLGLTAVMVVYLCVGAAIFNALEADNERRLKEALEADIDQFLLNNTCVDRRALNTLLFKASRDVELMYYILNNATHLDRWDFSGAFGFSISVVTTIGFGNLAPQTMEGKSACVIYALVGIPVMMLVLAGIGEKLVIVFKRINQCNVCSANPQVNRVLNTVLILVLGLLVGFVLPASLFHFIEDWHFLEALYFCFTTLSTIGFGDYIIGIHEQKISEGVWHEVYEVVAYVWILFGLAYVSLAIKYISEMLVSKVSTMERRTVRRLGITHKRTKKQRSSTSQKSTQIHQAGARRLQEIRRMSRKSSSSYKLPNKPEAETDEEETASIDPEESPPPAYISEIGRLSDEWRQRSSSPSRSSPTNGHSLADAEVGQLDSNGVQLVSVNYI